MEKEAAEPDEPQPEEVEKILGLIGDEIRRSRRSQRAIERSLRLSQGYLGSLLRGRIKLKVSHLYLLGRELGFEPAVLLIRAAPPLDPESVARELARPEPAQVMTSPRSKSWCAGRSARSWRGWAGRKAQGQSR